MAGDAPYNVAIVGGGAVGLAVLLRLVEKGTKGLRVVMIEKQSSIGPGLAYSEACVGTRINMHSRLMSLYVSDQEHFDRWMKESPSVPGGEQFPPRQYYGKYLNSVLTSVTDSAAEKGIEVDIHTSTEVLDMEQTSNGWSLELHTGAMIQATDVSLCLGNQMSQKHRHLNGTPLYFGNPWPNTQFLTIPKTASIAILGSRLTAIDEALYLTDRGYTGQIYFLSRSGTLPKIQGDGHIPERSYMTWNLARELEKNPAGAIMTIVSRLHQEMIHDNNGKSVFEFYRPELDILDVFKNDVETARAGHVPGQGILQQCGPVLERYWKCLSEPEQAVFTKEYLGVMTAHRNAMPLRTAERLLKIMVSGQLRVLALNTKSPITHADGTFTIPVATSEGAVYANALIESTGIEGNPHNFRTPLMQNLLARKIVRAHAAGGVHCDHQTLAVAKGAYIIGSMTRGVHFYSTSIDRNVRQAERIADTILGVPLRKPLHVALFVGNDLHSHLQVSKIVHKLMAQGQLPFIYLAEPKTSDEAASHEQRKLAFYERQILHTTITPQLGSSTEDAEQLTIQQLRARFPLLVQTVSDVNSPSFIRSLASNYIDLGFTFRSSHEFKAEAVQYFNGQKGLLNLAPGVQAASTISSETRGYGYTLRKVTETSDCGELVDIHAAQLDSSKALLNALNSIWHAGAEMVSSHTDATSRGLPTRVFTREEETNASYAYPTVSELENVRLVDEDDMQQVLLQSFGSRQQKEALESVISDACSSWDARKTQTVLHIKSQKSCSTLVEREVPSTENSSAAVSVTMETTEEKEGKEGMQAAMKAASRRARVRKSIQVQVQNWARVWRMETTRPAKVI